MIELVEKLDASIGQHDRWMPIQVSGATDLRIRRGERLCIVRRIPWELVDGAACEKQSDRNHGQTVARIAERGGYSACEALCVIAGVEYQRIDEVLAHRLLYALHVAFNRGRRRDVDMLRQMLASEQATTGLPGHRTGGE